MFETSNKIRQKDLEELAAQSIFDEFKSKTIMVTGATGLIGSEIVLGLLCANRLKNLDIKVVAMVRNEAKSKKVFQNVLNNPHLEIIVQDVNMPVQTSVKADFVIHAASITASKEIISKPVEAAQTTILGILNILEYARIHKVKSTVYLSSIEIYGKTRNVDIKENDIGVIDPLNIRNVYSLSKKLAENICASYVKEYNTNVKIARLTQTFGAGISDNENRVFAQFARSVVEHKDLVLHTDGCSYKNYCYITDAVTAILTILAHGEPAEAYNVANYNTAASIKNIADMLAKIYSVGVSYSTGENHGYNDKIELKLNPGKLEQLGWQPSVGLEEMFDRLIKSLENF